MSDGENRRRNLTTLTSVLAEEGAIVKALYLDGEEVLPPISVAEADRACRAAGIDVERELARSMALVDGALAKARGPAPYATCGACPYCQCAFGTLSGTCHRIVTTTLQVNWGQPPPADCPLRKEVR